uniref:Protein kinase domain-containing protein n=1 Tax=Ditylenchus dipsaci TaxID=166011 RepID=A0A915EBI1_9BILA
MEHLIGKGRFSRVYKATCRVSGRHFAIKFFKNICSPSTSLNNSSLTPSFGREDEWDGHEELSLDGAHCILEEIQALKTVLGHPNLVGYFGTAVFNSQVVLILHQGMLKH